MTRERMLFAARTWLVSLFEILVIDGPEKDNEELRQPMKPSP